MSQLVRDVRVRWNEMRDSGSGWTWENGRESGGTAERRAARRHENFR